MQTDINLVADLQIDIYFINECVQKFKLQMKRTQQEKKSLNKLIIT